MTEQELTELEALAEKATRGPWYTTVEEEKSFPCIRIMSEEVWLRAQPYGIEMHTEVISHTANPGSKEQDSDNAAFIAAARTAVPALIAEVRRLRERANKK